MWRILIAAVFALLDAASARAQAACGEPFTPIARVQGRGAASPLRGLRMAIEGVVSAARTGSDELGGFFLQDPAGDADPSTSDAVFVFAPGTAVREGDWLRVSGTAVEFFGQTEIASVESIETCGRGALAPLAVALPHDDLESLEGMLVRFSRELFVTDTFDLHRFGEVELSAGGPLAVPTDGPAGRADPQAALAENRRRRIRLDDGRRVTGPRPVPYLVGGSLRRGDRIADLTGVIGFAFGAFRVHPTEPVAIDPEPRPRLLPPRRALRFASLNLHNYWTTLDDGENGARGADSPAELARQRAKLVAALRGLHADVIALQELEKNGAAAIGDLLVALNAGCRRPTWCAVTAPELPGIAADRIEVGLIYRCARLRPVGLPVADPDRAHGGGRAPLAQRFRAPGFELGVVVAHLKSKDCSGARGLDADLGDGQGCFNARRTRQAEALLRFLELGWRPADEPVLLLGDLNAYSEEDPLRVLRARLVHLLRDPAREPASHSYVFGGAHGLLDHALATPDLAGRVRRAGVWAINADEPRLLSYDDDVLDPGELLHELNPTGGFAANAWRSSDHDPVFVDLAPAGARRQIAMR
jgi:predicted extracellular nuclease